MAEDKDYHDLVRVNLEKNKYSKFRRRRPRYKIGKTKMIQQTLYKVICLMSCLLRKIHNVESNYLEPFSSESESNVTQKKFS